MKATYFLGNQQFETREVELRRPAPDEVVLSVAACGICGTDVHIYHGDKGSAEVTPPVVLGHELAGVVAETGCAVTELRVGDRVTVDPNIYCGSCHFCAIGKKQHCEHLTAIGVNRDGGFAEKCVVPAKQCRKIDSALPLRYFAMTEPLACCLHGIDLLSIRAGDTVCVIGDGAIGLIMLQLARLSGASKVILSSRKDNRREIAEELGADAVINPMKGDLREQLMDVVGRPGVDVVIECVGKVQATEQAFSIADRGAKIMLFSVPSAGARYSLALEDVFQKELKIYGSFINPDTQERAAGLIASGRIRLDRIITHSYPMEKLEEAIHMQMSGDSIKVIIEPGVV